MIESNFIEISNVHNGVFKKFDTKVNGNLGSKIFITIYSLQLKHDGIDIQIDYEFGNSNVAEITFEMDTDTKVPHFEMRTKDHFSRLFSFNKNPWKIESKKDIFASKVIDYLDQSNLKYLANKEAFEPILKGIDANGKYNFNTKFYLGFNNKEESLLPIITFHQLLIDHIKKNYCM